MNVPRRYESTVKLIEDTFPGGIPADDYLPLLRLLHEEMTFRAIASVMEFFGKSADEAYLDASLAESTEGPASGEVERVRAKLVPHGWNGWKAETDIEEE